MVERGEKKKSKMPVADDLPASSPRPRDDDIDEGDDAMEESGAPDLMTLPPVPCPADRPEAIHAIVETVDRYNPENLPILEDYVRDQMLNNTIDRTANLAVLKLYQFNPDLTNISIVISILALALANLPDPDFNLALCQLNEVVMDHPSVAHLVKMQHLLESCQFKQFWEALEEDVDVPEADGDEPVITPKTLLEEFPEFDTRVRRFISSTLAETYQTIPLSLLSTCLNYDMQDDAEDLADWLKVIGCTVNSEDSSLFDFPVKRETFNRPSVAQENVRFEQLTKIIGAGRLTF
ncbi:armadillo-type protein [Zopfochytrium polystomum]|nr:armadillo-type protein [Zopfochytrium polystomum]